MSTIYNVVMFTDYCRGS